MCSRYTCRLLLQEGRRFSVYSRRDLDVHEVGNDVVLLRLVFLLHLSNHRHSTFSYQTVLSRWLHLHLFVAVPTQKPARLQIFSFCYSMGYLLLSTFASKCRLTDTRSLRVCRRVDARWSHFGNEPLLRQSYCPVRLSTVMWVFLVHVYFGRTLKIWLFKVHLHFGRDFWLEEAGDDGECFVFYHFLFFRNVASLRVRSSCRVTQLNIPAQNTCYCLHETTEEQKST